MPSRALKTAITKLLAELDPSGDPIRIQISLRRRKSKGVDVLACDIMGDNCYRCDASSQKCNCTTTKGKPGVIKKKVFVRNWVTGIRCARPGLPRGGARAT